MEIKCPKCAAADPMYSKKRGVYVCEECGHEFAPEKPFEPQRIFISYGHDEHMALALRLRDDLRERGHEAWFDEERLQPGHDWEGSIEKGLSRAAEGKPRAAVVLLLTPHSVRRPDGYCLNEVARALALGLRIVPLMVVESEPPLSICRIQWLDMRECIPIHEKEALYASRYERLLAALEEENLDFEGAQSRLLKALQPIRFSADILNLLRDFTGRKWLLDEVDRWFKDPRGSKIFWLTGAPGTGKSAVAAWIREHRREIAAFHFCDICSEEKRDPAKLVRSVAYQLSTQLPEYRDRLSRLDLDEIVGEYREAYTLFDKLVVQPLAEEFPDPGRTLVVLVDALDEATHDRRNEIARFLARGAAKTPGWLRFFVTSRPEPEIVSALQSHSPRVLDASGEENLADLRRYLASALPGITPGQTEEILRRSEGVFLYVRHVVESVRNGSLSLDRIDLFPRGLGDVYLQFFERQFGADLKEYEEKITPVLQPLFAAVEPLRLDFLRSVCRIEEATELERVFNRLGSLFPVSGEGEEATIRPFHRSLVDWISDRRSAGHFVIAPSDGHRVLAEHCLQEYRKGVEHLSPYALRHLPAHLIEAGRWDDLIGDDVTPGVLTDLRYIGARSEAGQVYDLTKDYNTALDALPEFREEREYLAKRDETMRRYNAALKEYAGKRYDWLKSKEAGFPTQEPPYPELPDILKDGNRPPIPEVSLPRAARLRHFVNFVWGNTWALSKHPQGLLPLAYNSAEEGPVAKQAEKLMESYREPWLRHSPRSPLPPLRPQCMRVFEGHASAVLGLILTSDGFRVLSWSQDMTMRLWDLESGECLQIFEEHKCRVNGVQLMSDGSRALSWSEDRTLRLWELESGMCLRVFKGHEDGVDGMLLKSDERLILSWSKDQTLRLWSIESGECLRIFNGHKNRIKGMVLTPAEDRVLSWSCDDTLRLWDIGSGECIRVFKGHEDDVWGALLVSDGSRALSWSKDSTLRLWDMESGENLRVFNGHDKAVGGVLLMLNSRRILSRSEDKTLRLWDLENGECLRVFKGHSNTVWGVHLMSDGRRALSWSKDSTLRLWNMESGECLHVFEGHNAAVAGVLLTSDDHLAISRGWDYTIRLWNIEYGKCLRVFEGHEDAVRGISLMSDERRLLSWSLDSTLRLWNMESGECSHVFEGQNAAVAEVLLTSDGDRALSWSWTNKLYMWEVESGKCLRVFNGHENAVWGVRLTSDGCSALSWSEDTTLRLWDLKGGECLRVFKGHKKTVWGALLQSNIHRVLSWSEDKTLRLWNMANGECLRVFDGHENVVWGVLLTPDDHRALSWSEDTTLRLWDLEGSVCLRIFKGHEKTVWGALLTPSGCHALSWSGDQTLRLWDLESGECLRVFEGHKDTVLGVQLTPDGCHALSWSEDKTFRLWNLENGMCLRVFEGHEDSVRGLYMASTGCRVFSWSWDKTFRLWDMQNGKCLHEFKGHERGVEGVLPVLDDHCALSWSSDDTLRLWDIESGKCLCVEYLSSLPSSALTCSRSKKRIVYGTVSGQLSFLSPVNIPKCLRGGE